MTKSWFNVVFAGFTLWFSSREPAFCWLHRQSPMSGAGSAGSESHQRELAQATGFMMEQRRLTQHTAYQAQQSMWFANRHKRGPPSTVESSMGTPQQDTEMEEPQPPLPAMGATPLFQPIPVERDASFTMAAAQAGVDINSEADVQAYLATPLTTRAQVLDTIRQYHVGVIRPEDLISQVEQVAAKLDDRILKTQDNMNWLASECRIQQKRESGLLVVTTGWDTSMSPQQRLYQLNWMLGQVESVRQFLVQRSYNATDSCTY